MRTKSTSEFTQAAGKREEEPVRSKPCSDRQGEVGPFICSGDSLKLKLTFKIPHKRTENRNMQSKDTKYLHLFLEKNPK